ncbi:MAG TPA: class I SAM-dependent methyltransferase [Vicinamibacterales bacterium]|nr:class I SAM-dependent methyltransferase [Vicinamibacterales bacterium]
MVDRLLDLTRQAEANHFWYHGFRSYLLPVFADALAGRAHARILDVGCGTGYNLGLLARHGASFGLDLNERGLSLARDIGRPLVRADTARLPFADGIFDLVTSFDMMQCIPTDREAVREMARVLKPGGVAVISMAALEILHGDHSEVWQEYRRYNRASARALAEQAGLRPERVTFMFAVLFPLLLVSRGLQRLTRRFRDVRDDTDITIPPAPVNGLLSSLLGAEAALSRRVGMPMGSSLLVVARKTGGPEGPPLR